MYLCRALNDTVSVIPSIVLGSCALSLGYAWSGFCLKLIIIFPTPTLWGRVINPLLSSCFQRFSHLRPNLQVVPTPCAVTIHNLQGRKNQHHFGLILGRRRKFTVRTRRAPGQLLLPNQFQNRF